MAKTGKCKACNNLVSKTAKLCPHCGEGKPCNNKGGISWLFAVIFILFVMGIMSDGKQRNPTVQDAQDTKVAVKQGAVFNEDEIWLIKKRAERKDPDALYLLSYAYSEPYQIDTGLESDPYLSLRLLESAAQLGQPDAQYGLSLHYSIGKGVPENHTTAFELMKKAATSGKPRYISELASYYSRGRGVAKNIKIANELLIKSANQGFGVSQAILATDFKHGHSMPKDLVQAYKWHNLAKMTGHPGGGASGYRGLSFDELLAEEMTEDEVKKGKHLINEFLTKNPQFPIEEDHIRELRSLYQKVKEREVLANEAKAVHRNDGKTGFLLQDSFVRENINDQSTGKHLLKKGTQVAILEMSEDQEWIKVEYSDGNKQGYIPTKHLAVFSDEDKPHEQRNTIKNTKHSARERYISPEKNPDVINGQSPWVVLIVINGNTYGGAVFPGYYQCANAGIRAVWSARSPLTTTPEKAKIYCQPENMRGKSLGVRVFAPGQRH